MHPPQPLDWLGQLARTRDETPGSPLRSRWRDGVEDLVVLSPDGERALVLESREDELLAFHLPTGSSSSRAASMDRVAAVAARIQRRLEVLDRASPPVTARHVYEISSGRFGPLSWVQVHTPDGGGWRGAFWRAVIAAHGGDSTPPRLSLSPMGGKHLLDIVASGNHVDVVLYPL